jgi:hypothetical protein
LRSSYFIRRSSSKRARLKRYHHSKPARSTDSTTQVLKRQFVILSPITGFPLIARVLMVVPVLVG